jgi:hypothetical protein
MCVIAICPEKVRPDLNTVQACWDANPHGAGMAWREKGEVHWLKSNDVSEIFRTANAKKGEVVLHFRIASIGRVCPELRHPFPVSKRAGLHDRGIAKAVLFQNGTWGAYREALEFAKGEGHKLPDGEMSDARAAAFLCSIYGPEFLQRAGHSRWVFFGSRSTSIFGDWTTVGRIKYSNTYWRTQADWHRSTFKDESEDEDSGEPELCSNADRSPCNPLPSKVAPGAPGYKTKVERELELWDMSATASYWDIINRKKSRR